MCALKLGSANWASVLARDAGSVGAGVGEAVRATTACRVGAGPEPKAPARNSAPKTRATTTKATPAPTSRLGPDRGAGSGRKGVGVWKGVLAYLSTKKRSPGSGGAAIGSYFVTQRGHASSSASKTSWQRGQRTIFSVIC